MPRVPFWKLLALIACLLVPGLWSAAADRGSPPKRVAGVVTVYYHNSHADMLAGRLLQTDTLDGKGDTPSLELVSLYTDQVPENDISRKLSSQHGFPIFRTVEETLTLGTGKLAVDGVLLIAEHGKYPESPTGQFQFPKRRLFAEIADVFRKSGRVVPVFCDKHLADTWEDAKWIYDTAKELQIPLMAGSSLPYTWRKPEATVDSKRPLKEILLVSYHRLDTYGFHAMEAAQCLAECRPGGEAGIAAVQCLTGEDVWKAGEQGLWPRDLLDAALARLEMPRGGDKPLPEVVKVPELFVIEHVDGLRTYILTLNGKVAEWAGAWRYADDPAPQSTLFYTQEGRPFMHFTYQLKKAEEMMQTGRSPVPIERTLLTSGALDLLLISKKEGGRRIETPQLRIAYKGACDWKQPPPPPPDRPIFGQ